MYTAIEHPFGPQRIQGCSRLDVYQQYLNNGIVTPLRFMVGTARMHHTLRAPELVTSWMVCLALTKICV